MKSLIFFGFFMVFGTSFLLSQENNRFEIFVHETHHARELWRILLNAPLENHVCLKDTETINKIDKISIKLDKNNSVSQFLQTIVNALLKEKTTDAVECFAHVDKNIVMCIEHFLMAESLSQNEEKRGGLYFTKVVADVLPINGKQGQSGYTARIRWKRYHFCPSSSGMPQNVSVFFQELGFYDLAWKAYLEEAYFKNPLYFLLEKKYSDTPLSHQNAHYWPRVAECAYRAGECDLAWGFLMKAAVFGDDKLYEQTKETARLWSEVEAGKAELPKPEPLSPEERKKKFKEIVMAYKEMNAHPRAWAIIDEYKDEFDDPEGLKKEIQDDWLDLTNMLCSPDSAVRVILYGYELLKVEVAEDGTRTETRPYKPLDVKIPWIYPEGWRESAQKMLNEEMKKLGVSCDRFRTWHAQGGKFSMEGKFISCVDGKVTLEKKDGSTVTLALDSLMAGDQNFVRYCLQAEKKPETVSEP